MFLGDSVTPKNASWRNSVWCDTVAERKNLAPGQLSRQSVKQHAVDTSEIRRQQPNKVALIQPIYSVF